MFSRPFLFFIIAMFLNFFSRAFDSDDKTLRTISTELETKTGKVEFEIHFEKKDEVFANRVVEIIKNDSKKVFDYFSYPPTTKFHISVNNSYTTANGSARVFPRNLIELFTFPPTGRSHLMTDEDWIRGLVLHELVHVIHMDQTKGFLKALRYLLGSYGKLGGVVPRWFAEGLATWAETNFTEGGRGKNEVMRWELKRKMLDPNFCSSIDCLNDPDAYPYGSLPYWVGTFFLTDVEQNHPGALACIVEANSWKVMGFLNSSFVKCINQSATSYFNLWRQRFIEDSKELATGPKLSKLEIGQDFSIQNGLEVIGHDFFFSGFKNDRQVLIEKNLISQKEEIVAQDFHIDSLAQIGDKLLLTGETYNRGEGQRSSYLLSNKKELKKVDKFFGDYPFYFNKSFYGFVYRDHRWMIFSKAELEKEEEKDQKPLVEFPRLTQIRMPYVHNGILYVKLDGDLLIPSHQVWSINLGKVSEKKILFSSSKAFDIFGYCEESIFLKEKNGWSLLEGAKKYSQSSKTLDNIITGSIGKDKSVFAFKNAPKNLYAYQLGCQSLVSDFKKTNPIVINKISTNIENVKTNESESYLSFSHFLPHAWMLSYLSNGQFQRWSLNTSLVDPRERHTLSVNLDHYIYKAKNQDEELVPSVSYVYAPSFGEFGASRIQSYFYNVITKRDDKRTYQSAYFQKDFSKSFLSYKPTLIYSNHDVFDVLGPRKFEKYSLFQPFFFKPLMKNDFFQGLSLSAEVFYQNSKNGRSFSGQEVLGSGVFHLWDGFARRGLDFNYRGTWAKNNKDGIADGVFYGGGTSEYSKHPFYGVKLDEAFGNEIQTYQFELEQNLFRPFSAWGLTPVYFKTVNLMAGHGMLKTDITLADPINTFYVDRKFTNFYYGINSEVTIFYGGSAKLNMVFSEVSVENGKSYSNFDFVVNSEFSF